MRLRLAFLALAFSLLTPLGSEAAACLMLIDADPNVTPEQARALERQRARDQVEARLARARANWAAGMDGAAALSEMLVPNVRPVHIVYTSCGPLNEMDHAEGSETYRMWFAESRYERVLRDYEHVFESFDGTLPGPPCNAEFRSRFAGHLRSRLTPRQMRAAYLFLGARWTSLDPNALRTRLMHFASRGQRRPPLALAVRDERQREEIVAWMRGNAAGRAVQRASDDFWRENAPLLDSMAATCPAAAARWEADRARFLAMVAAEEVRQRALIAAEKR
jgi:hypothetical protein